MIDRFLNEKNNLKYTFRFFTPQNSVKHNIIYLTLQNNNNNMTFLLSTLPLDLENIIAKNVEYKRNFQQVCKVINRFGEERDYNMKYNGTYETQTEYQQFIDSDLYWVSLHACLEGECVSDNCFTGEIVNGYPECDLYEIEHCRYNEGGGDEMLYERQPEVAEQNRQRYEEQAKTTTKHNLMLEIADIPYFHNAGFEAVLREYYRRYEPENYKKLYK